MAVTHLQPCLPVANRLLTEQIHLVHKRQTTEKQLAKLLCLSVMLTINLKNNTGLNFGTSGSRVLEFKAALSDFDLHT